MSQLPDIPRGVSLFNGELRGLLNDMVRAINDLQGSAGSGSGLAGGRSIPGAGMIPRLHFWAKITDYTTDGVHRWKYGWEEVQLAALGGYDNWSTTSGGRSGTTATNPARNFIEQMNAATGIQGNGIDVANLIGTFEVKPAPLDVIVLMFLVHRGDGSVGYWFSYENSVDGECP